MTVKLSLQQALSRAKAHERSGETETAANLYHAVLSAHPDNVQANEALATLQTKRTSEQERAPPQEKTAELARLYLQGNFTIVAKKAEYLAKQFPNSGVLCNILGAANAGLKRDATAEKFFREAIRLNPSDPDAHNNLGNMLHQQGNLDAAVKSFARALELKPDFFEAHNNLGNALKNQGRLDAAVMSYARALELKPDYAGAHMNLGNAFVQQGRLDAAVESFTRALELKPDHAEGYINLGNVFKNQGRLDAAVMIYARALELKPDHAEAHNNFGNLLIRLGRLDAAVESFTRALKLKPDYAEAHNNLGVSLQHQGRLGAAVDSIGRALKLKPDYSEALNNLGVALRRQGKLVEAAGCFLRALKLKPDYAEAHTNLGVELKRQGRFDEAVECYSRALSLKPDNAVALAQKFYLQALMCDWSGVQGFQELAGTLGIGGEHVSPFSLLSLEDNAAHQKLRSENWAVQKYKQKPIPLPAKSQEQPGRLRIGYFSADFHDHPTLYLMSGILEHHDRKDFEIYAYSYGLTKHGGMRERLLNRVDNFEDIQGTPDIDVVNLAREQDLHIAVDLKGYTQHTRSSLFAYRLAPVQINYLGFPGTMGANFMDYIIADDVVIPENYRKYYSEKIIYMPNSYQPNDDTRSIAVDNRTRCDFGLPDGGFVFCCFNNSYKITPREFNIWMRLLRKVDGSVLWLLHLNRWAEENLRMEAEARGVDSARLVFAERTPQAEHLARHAHADLFLDTFNYNAHTTASDALWAGLPVVTKVGEQFAARVAASLLHAVGLPELVTESEEEYEALALKIATNKGKLGSIRQILSNNKATRPLFDTDLYTRHLEDAYSQAYQRYFEGKAPKTVFAKNTPDLEG